MVYIRLEGTYWQMSLRSFPRLQLVINWVARRSKGSGDSRLGGRGVIFNICSWVMSILVCNGMGKLRARLGSMIGHSNIDPRLYMEFNFRDT
jgi:hypothetical protein